MALLQQPGMLGIGCSNVLARARVQQCLAAASHSHMPCLQVLLHASGSSKKQPSQKIGLSSSRRRDLSGVVVAEASAAAGVTPASSSPGGISVSDVLWPSAGAFLAMAVLGRMDQMMAYKGVSLTIAPLGAVCAVLFTAPGSPALP